MNPCVLLAISALGTVLVTSEAAFQGESQAIDRSLARPGTLGPAGRIRKYNPYSRGTRGTYRSRPKTTPDPAFTKKTRGSRGTYRPKWTTEITPSRRKDYTTTRRKRGTYRRYSRKVTRTYATWKTKTTMHPDRTRASRGTYRPRTTAKQRKIRKDKPKQTHTNVIDINKQRKKPNNQKTDWTWIRKVIRG